MNGSVTIIILIVLFFSVSACAETETVTISAKVIDAADAALCANDPEHEGCEGYFSGIVMCEIDENGNILECEE